MGVKDVTSSFMERKLAANTVFKVSPGKASTTFDNNSDDTDQMLQLPSKPLERFYNTRSKIQRELAYFGVVTKSQVD